MDTVGNELAKSEIAVIKVAVPNMACEVIDWAIQAHVGGRASNEWMPIGRAEYLTVVQTKRLFA